MSEAALKFDKYAIVQQLERRGLSHANAEGIAEALTAVDFSEVATKRDPKELELRMQRSRISLNLPTPMPAPRKSRNASLSTCGRSRLPM
jgi:hypothetical protein